MLGQNPQPVPVNWLMNTLRTNDLLSGLGSATIEGAVALIALTLTGFFESELKVL
jgi:hypothetical protein